MARAPVRSQPPRPAVALPPWLLWAALGVVVLAVAAVALWKINAVNDRLQAERRLTGDPALGSWFEAMRTEIAEYQAIATDPAARPPKLAEAVWLGTVTGRCHTRPKNQPPALDSITLSPAHLLAGRRSPVDPRGDGGVTISVLGFGFARGEPQKGEQWVFAVRRINGGNNIVHAAHPAP